MGLGRVGSRCGTVALPLFLLNQGAADGHVLDALLRIARRPDSDPRWRDLVATDLQSLIERYAVRNDSRRNLDRLAGELSRVITGISVANLADVSDHVLGRVAATEGRMAGEHGAVGSKISELLAQAASGATGTAYDPACGIGEVLLQLWQRSSDSDRLRLAGVDVNREYVLVCRQRCFLAGAEATIECADILERDPHPDLRADVVVAEPPLGLAMPTGFSVTVPRWALAGPPPKNNSDTAFLQHAITHLTHKAAALLLRRSAPHSRRVRRPSATHSSSWAASKLYYSYLQNCCYTPPYPRPYGCCTARTPPRRQTN